MTVNTTDVNNTPGPEGGSGNEAQQKKRRRRRGKRPPSAPAAGSGNAAPSTESPSPQNSAGTSQGRTSGSGQAEQSRSKGRRHKRRKEDRQSEAQHAPAQLTTNNTQHDAGPALIAEKTENTPKAEKTEKSGKRQRPDTPPKRESVLQRRLHREAVNREDLHEETPTPVSGPINATSVDSYISQLRGWQREVVGKLRSMVKSQAADAEETILWSQPVYTLNGPVIYIKAFSDHVNLGFWRGNELDDPSNRLSGELPTMRHITIRHVNEMDKELFEALIRQAVKLNRDKGDPTQ